jgi:hypothetical protein
MPNEPDGAVGFEKDIKPLFRAKDRDAMKASFDLWDYADVVRVAQAILGAVSSGKMPCDGPWPPAQVELFTRWMKGGTPP